MRDLQREREKRSRAKKDLLTFASCIEIPGAPLRGDDDDCEEFVPIKSAFGAHHLLWLECLQKVEDGEIPRLMGLMPPGSAKALALDTPIPTVDGWKCMGELRTGDKVFDERGEICEVTWVSPTWKERPVYRVKTDCGDEIIADEDHEWLVSLCRKKERGEVFKLKTSKQLATKRKFGLGGELIAEPRSKRPMIKRASFLKTIEKELILDPYILGLWLGDGNTLDPRLTCSGLDVDWLLSELARCGIKTSKNKRLNGNWSISLLDVRNKFSQLGLIGGSPVNRTAWGKKFIPSVYLRGSYEQRLSLLQGLIDTDGHVTPFGEIQFTNTNYNIALGAAELVRTLGAKASISSWQPAKGELAWRVHFFLKNAARMPRKRIFTKDGTRTPNTYIDIEPCGYQDTKCIEVNSPSHLYLCGRSMTPTHNSTYTSVVMPTHFMGRFPRSSVIVASYGSDLPRKFGRRARSIVKQPVYQRVFGSSLASDSAAADEWALDNGSEWMAAGILTGITGNRVDLVVWDDLIKGREQADSEVIRNKTWDAYFDDLLTRKKPKAREVGITTRWHEDDPAGRILPLKYNGESGWIKGRDGNDWYVLCLPAECERADDPLGRKVGDFIWPEWFPPGHFAPFKRNARTWNALFQQRPAPESGDFFKAEWLRPYDVMPQRDILRVYGASDYAVTKDGGNYTVHVVVGVDPSDNIYLLDLWRKQASPEVWIEAFCDLVERWKPMGWAEESGQIKSGVGPFLHKRLMERRLYVVRAPYPSRVDKAIRAQSIRGRMAMSGLYVPTYAPWYPDLKAELMVFPNGNNDDQVDALSLIGQVLDKMIPGEKAKPAPEKAKIFSTDPATCTVTLEDMWEANGRNKKDSKILRIA